MVVFNVLLGLVLLLLGHQVFWLFVGGIGFVTALELVERLALPWPNWLILVVAIVAGVIGALLAIFLQKVAIGLAGFLAGGYVILGFLDILGLQIPVLSWVLAFVAGVIGLVLAVALFDWALIILSSLSGAALIARSLDLNQPLPLLIFVIAAIVGIAVQASTMRRMQTAT